MTPAEQGFVICMPVQIICSISVQVDIAAIRPIFRFLLWEPTERHHHVHQFVHKRWKRCGIDYGPSVSIGAAAAAADQPFRKPRHSTEVALWPVPTTSIFNTVFYKICPALGCISIDPTLPSTEKAAKTSSPVVHDCIIPWCFWSSSANCPAGQTFRAC